MESSSDDLISVRPFSDPLGRQISERSPLSTLVPLQQTPGDPWRLLSDDMLEYILARLPLFPLKVCKEVCKRWKSILSTPQFDTLHRLLGEQQVRLVCYRTNDLVRSESQVFAYEEDADAWVFLPAMEFPSHKDGSLASATGVVYAVAAPGNNKLVYKLTRSASCPSSFLGTWEQTPAMNFPRHSPVVSVAFGTGKKRNGHKLVVAGGMKNSKPEHMAVEVLDSETGAWEVYGNLPQDFYKNNSSLWMSGVVCDSKLYVTLICKWIFYAMDLSLRQWTPVMLPRPQGLITHRIMAIGATLVVAGFCNQPEGYALNVWKLDPNTQSLLQIGSISTRVFSTRGRDLGVPILNINMDFLMNDNVIYAYKTFTEDYVWVKGEISLKDCKTEWRVLPSMSPSGYKFNNTVTFCTSMNICP